MLKLPSRLENDSETAARIRAALQLDRRPLWGRGTLNVPVIEFTKPIAHAISNARRCGDLLGGLEKIEEVLECESVGLRRLHQRGVSNAGINRLLILAQDGSERFYRTCERLLLRYQDRMLGFVVKVDGAELGRMFFGKNAPVRALVVAKRDSVMRVLCSLQNSANEERDILF